MVPTTNLKGCHLRQQLYIHLKNTNVEVDHLDLEANIINIILMQFNSMYPFLHIITTYRVSFKTQKPTHKIYIRVLHWPNIL